MHIHPHNKLHIHKDAYTHTINYIHTNTHSHACTKFLPHKQYTQTCANKPSWEKLARATAAGGGNAGFYLACGAAGKTILTQHSLF
jgi:hypothetical protein